MRKFQTLSRLMIFGLMFFTAFYAMADDATVLSPGDFINQVAAFVQSTQGGLQKFIFLSGIIMLIIASMKVSFINKLLWSKLGSLQIWVAPVFGLAAGILALGPNLTAPAAFAYISAGAGAVYIHELLDLLKAIPGLGQVYVGIINFIEGYLGGPAAQQAQQATKAEQQASTKPGN